MRQRSHYHGYHQAIQMPDNLIHNIVVIHGYIPLLRDRKWVSITLVFRYYR